MFVNSCICVLQANSLEFEPALAWRRLHEAVRAAKRALRDEHAGQLAQLMQLYLQVRLLLPAHCLNSYVIVELT